MSNKLPRAGRDGWFAGRHQASVALGFVLVPLVVLAVLPAVIQGTSEAHRRELLQVDEPARALITQLQLALALDVAGTRGFLLTGEGRYIAAHQQARALRDRALAGLLPLLSRLGPTAARQAATLTSQLRLQDSALGALFNGSESRDTYTRRLDDHQARLEAAAAAAVRLDQVIARRSAARTSELQLFERVSYVITVLLVAVAVFAALLIARFARRHQALAVEAERRREELERVSESRTRLIRGFSHDVKNPLGAADGYAALLEDGVMGDLSDEQRKSIGRIRRSIGTSVRLITDLLDLARAEMGQVQITAAPADISAIVREVVEDFDAQAAAAGLTVELRTPGALAVMTDAARVGQVVANLMSNAVKYAPRSHVVVSADACSTCDGAPRAGRWIVVRVRDTGPGIPADKQNAVFQEFTRLDPDAQRGAGVGLATSRRLAQLMGGDLTLESEAGRGSTFALWLPDVH